MSGDVDDRGSAEICVLNARLREARTHVRRGQREEALSGFLWCYDHGAGVRGFGPIRHSFLLGDILHLARSFPPAWSALRERRDQAEEASMRACAGIGEMCDAVALNQRLGAPERNVLLFENIAKRAGASQLLCRAMLVLVIEDICSLRRYDLVASFQAEIVSTARNRLKSHVKRAKIRAASRWVGVLDDAAKLEFSQGSRNSAIAAVASCYEALVGIGELGAAHEVFLAVCENLGTETDVFFAFCERALRAGRQEAAHCALTDALRLCHSNDTSRIHRMAQQLGLTDG